MEINSGWFIKFEPDEKQEQEHLLNFLAVNGYEQNADGIKEFLLDTIYPEQEKEKRKAGILETLEDNPEIIERGIGAIGNLAAHLWNKKIFKK